ncbi:dihydrodipicolinate synthetase [Niabella ginsenosidivorans]|uniref:Dihydrodipicolinate synthetase n=1 Tax=Niabella ginsenosidivorans TaxID=1176587 RepID=A0A1A9I8N6_9BACT|nr:dihydrodipicolinate synthase family protein [Niabella ginsenosidivorans]ANH83041.1 dihydrodipicolinate synthetase [Niabella ginsenosidivorans]
MKFKKIEGLIAAPFAPLLQNGRLHIEVIPQYYQLLKRNKIAGAFINGSTGEGVSLTIEEKKQVAAAWAEAAENDPEFKIINLVGGASLEDCEEMAAYTEQLKLYAISFTSPFYFTPVIAQTLADCCRRVAAAAPNTPFYYYHIPALTGCNIPMYDLLNAIGGAIPNFAGIKYTHEDFMDFLSCMYMENGRYDMLWGRDENMLPALALGCSGAVGSTYNYAAPLYHELIKAFNDKEFSRARDLQVQAIEMIRLLGKYGGIAVGKAYMKLIGLDCGGFRLPVKNMDDPSFKKFMEDAERIGFYNFCSK